MSDLVENKGLADVAPAGGGTEVVNQQQQQQHEGDAGRGVDGVNQEHHDGAADDAQHAGVPGEVAKGGPKGRTGQEIVSVRFRFCTLFSFQSSAVFVAARCAFTAMASMQCHSTLDLVANVQVGWMSTYYQYTAHGPAKGL